MEIFVGGEIERRPEEMKAKNLNNGEKKREWDFEKMKMKLGKRVISRFGKFIGCDG